MMLPEALLDLLDAPSGAVVLARELAGLASAGRGDLAFAAAVALLAAESRGDGFVPFDDDAFQAVLSHLGHEGRDVEAELLATGLAAGSDDAERGLPFVVADGLLRSQRVAVQEARVGRRVRALLSAAPVARLGLEAALADVLARPAVRGGTPVVLDETQVAAIRTLAAHRLVVLSGGPGTGKTSVVVSLLRALARTGVTPTSIALAAPTGKAAQRLAASIADGLGSLGSPTPLDRELARDLVAPTTVHRLLGHSPVRGTVSRHESAPLSASWVVVDEASMLDLALFDRLLAALRPDATLVLVGDVHQLPSVGVGDVLRDLATHGAPVALLTRSHRMREDDPHGRAILLSAQALLRGENPFEALVETSAPTFRGVERAASAAVLGDGPLGDPRLARLARLDYAAEGGQLVPSGVAVFRELDAALSARRVLTPGRRTPGGSLAQNRRFHALAARRAGRAEGGFLPGEPLLVTRNDGERGLVNGDVGVALWVKEGDRRRPSLVVDRPDGPRVHPLDRVRDEVELAYAMTVHKAQGSEHDEVVFVVPEDPAALALSSRQLVYTAVTRAKRGLLVVGDPARLGPALASAVGRRSSLGRSLARP